MSEFKYLGNAVSFVPYSVGVADRATKPAAGYVEVGKCGSISIERTVNSKSVMAPAPGVMRRVDEIPTSSMTTVRAHLLDVGPLFWQLVWSSAALTAGAAVEYTPDAGSPIVKGWIKITQYDQADALYNTVEFFAALKLDGSVQFGEQPVEWDMTAEVIQSSVAAGTIATLA